MFDMNRSVGEERNPPTGFLATVPSLLKLQTCSNVEANGFVLYGQNPQNTTCCYCDILQLFTILKIPQKSNECL